jgi:hypothetical protein
MESVDVRKPNRRRRQMKKYVKPVLVILVGLWLVNVGFQMAMAKQISETVNDSRGRNAAVGAGIGGAGGIVTGLVIGGVGIATGGTAFAVGLPMMALLGAGGGALAGAATGTKEVIQQSETLYSPWAWGAILIVGLLLAWHGMKMFRETKRIVLEDPKALPQ